jgi:hypothetical protein
MSENITMPGYVPSALGDVTTMRMGLPSPFSASCAGKGSSTRTSTVSVVTTIGRSQPSGDAGRAARAFLVYLASMS